MARFNVITYVFLFVFASHVYGAPVESGSSESSENIFQSSLQNAKGFFSHMGDGFCSLLNKLGLEMKCVKQLLYAWFAGGNVTLEHIWTKCHRNESTKEKAMEMLAPFTTTTPPGVLEKAWENMGETLTDASNITVHAGEAVGNQVMSFLSGGVEAVKDTAKSVYGNITDPKSTPRRFVGDVIDDIGSFFNDAANSSVNAVKGAAETVENSDVLNRIGDQGLGAVFEGPNSGDDKNADRRTPEQLRQEEVSNANSASSCTLYTFLAFAAFFSII